MARLTILQHHPAEGPGHVAGWAARRGIGLRVLRPDLGELPGPDDGPLLLLGGPAAVHAPLDWLVLERAWLVGAVARGAAVFGICLGAQLLASVLGAAVAPLPAAETGWTRVDLRETGPLDVLQWHEDGFTLPPGADLEATNAACACQGFSLGGRLVGFQFHPEWSVGSVAGLNRHFGDASPLPREPYHARHARVAAWLDGRLDRWRAVW